MRRREFISRAALGSFALAADGLSPTQFAARAAEPPTPPRRPNFLFIYTDDQRWDGLGVVQREQGDKARFPWIQTPNQDRIAREGVRFRQAFVVNSLCAPSRACFLTGRYSHLNGVANNHTPFPVESVTHASELRKAGYKTGYFGKFHMGQQRGQRPGFDFSASFIGQGRYLDCPFEVNGVETPTTGWVDDVTTDYALKFIEAHQAQPFSVVVGFKSVHGPRTPREADQALFAGDGVKPAPNAEPPAPFRSFSGRPNRPKKAQGQGRGGDQLNYFRTLKGADDNIGRLLKALDDHHLAEDTVVIFASDNGYYFGEHGLGDKRSAYDESLRIPLLVRYPRLVQPGTVSDALVLNIDLAPTLLDLAGVKIPDTIQGKSWRPLLAGQTPADWRKAFFYEYFYENSFPTPTTLAVRTEDAKLIKYPGHEEWTELFDLKNDPLEQKNLAQEPSAKALRFRLEAEFERQAKAVEFKIPDFADTPPQAAAKAVPGA
jgi:arylsulfatase A-like enzyme